MKIISFAKCFHKVDTRDVYIITSQHIIQYFLTQTFTVVVQSFISVYTSVVHEHN